jgi:hypothetical protein
VPRVKHVVFFRFKKEAPVGEIEAIFAGLADLRRVIPGILDFSAGSYASPEGLGRGFTHGFVMTFADEATRDIYLPHPDHEALKRRVLPLLDGGIDGALAFDWVEE